MLLNAPLINLCFRIRESGTAVGEWDSFNRCVCFEPTSLHRPIFAFHVTSLIAREWMQAGSPFRRASHFLFFFFFASKRGLKDETPIYLMASTAVCLPKPTSKAKLFGCLVLRRLFDLFPRKACGSKAGERCCWFCWSVIIHFQQGLFQMRGFGRCITSA